MIVVAMSTLIGGKAYSQTAKSKLPSYYRILNVDSLINNTPNGINFLHEVQIYPDKNKTLKKYRSYDKLVRNFKKVYPYALELSSIYREIEDSIAIMDEYNAKKYIAKREDQIMAHYKPIMSKFSLQQAILLVKLVDRESGSTAYEIIKTLKGSVNAGFWQTFAVMFGNNLKKSYCSDNTIEYLVKMYKDSKSI